MQSLLDDPSAILAFYKEESSFHNILLGYYRQPNEDLFIIPINLNMDETVLPWQTNLFTNQKVWLGLLALSTGWNTIQWIGIKKTNTATSTGSNYPGNNIIHLLNIHELDDNGICLMTHSKSVITKLGRNMGVFWTCNETGVPALTFLELFDNDFPITV